MWSVKLEDGRVIEQFDRETGKEHRFGDIDLSKAKEVGWVIPAVEAINKIADRTGHLVVPFYSLREVRLKLNENRTPIIHFERSMSIQAGGHGMPVSEQTSYVLGVEEDGHRFILKIRPDGVIEVL